MIRCIFIISVLFYSCKEAIPADVIKQKKMQEILWDVLRADALSQQLVKNDSTKSLTNENVRLSKRVFVIHGIKQEQFDKSYSYYTKHPDVMRSMLDSIATQKVRIDTLQNQINSLQLNKDSAKQINQKKR